MIHKVIRFLIEFFKNLDEINFNLNYIRKKPKFTQNLSLMKKYFILSFAAFLMISCGKTLHESWNYFPNEVNLDTYNNLDFVKIKQGNTVTVKVEENPSTGYSWTSQSNSDCSVSMGTSSFSAGSNDGNMVGVPGVRTFEVKGEKTGSCLVEFQQFAPGEQNKPANRKGIYFIVE